MEATAMMKFALVMGVVLALTIGNLNVALGECTGNTNRDALQLYPCLNAAKDPNAPVSKICCDTVAEMGQNPKCLCDAMLSSTARSFGSNPKVAITIPSRCNIANRPKGYRCGPYTLP